MEHVHDTPAPHDPATPERLRRLPSRLLGLTAAHAERLSTRRLAAADARKWHYAVLAALEEGGPASQAALSRRTGIYRSDLVAVINELSARGLVERAADPDDRRRNVITATPAGRERLGRLDTVLAEVQRELLAPLTEAERDTLTDLLARLHTHHAANQAAHHTAHYGPNRAAREAARRADL